MNDECTFNDDGGATIFGHKYSLEDMQHFLWDSIAPAYCTHCKEHVDDYEPDAHNYTHWESEGGCGKETVSSILILLGIC